VTLTLTLPFFFQVKNYTNLDFFKIGTYNAEKQALGFYTLPILHGTESYGGVLLEGGTLTDYCQVGLKKMSYAQFVLTKHQKSGSSRLKKSKHLINERRAYM